VLEKGMAWFVVRLLIVVGGALEGENVARWQYPDASPSFLAGFLLVMFLLGATIVVALSALTKQALRPGQAWPLPSWRISPLPGSPAQSFHALAWYFIAGGVSATVATVWVPHSSLQGGCALTGLGLGFLTGCHASVHLFRSAFSQKGAALTMPATKLGSG
jgi:hypothetical protein